MLKYENIYLDYQASTPLSQKASEAIHNVVLNNFANPHSTDHAEGWRASKIVEDASHTIAEFIGALEDEIIFVSGATEANNLAIIGTGLTAHKEEHHRKNYYF